jgi:hypothetical protein
MKHLVIANGKASVKAVELTVFKEYGSHSIWISIRQAPSSRESHLS